MLFALLASSSGLQIPSALVPLAGFLFEGGVSSSEFQY
jgi:hypothetical protein